MLPPRIVAELDAPCRTSLYGRFEVSGCIPLTNSTAVEGGVFTGLTTSGTYNVSSDCTGSITYTAGVASGETQDMVIVSGGTEIFGIDAVPSTTATFVAKKQ